MGCLAECLETAQRLVAIDFARPRFAKRECGEPFQLVNADRLPVVRQRSQPKGAHLRRIGAPG